MATPSPQLSALALREQLQQAAQRATGAAQAAQDAAQRLQAGGTAFQGSAPNSPSPSPAQPAGKS